MISQVECFIDSKYRENKEERKKTKKDGFSEMRRVDFPQREFAGHKIYINATLKFPLRLNASGKSEPKTKVG